MFSGPVCTDLSVVFFKQKTAYEMRISDWSSDVCSSDLHRVEVDHRVDAGGARLQRLGAADLAAVDGHGGIVRHVLRLERTDRHPAPGEQRSEDRSVGKECVSTWRSRW